MGETLPLLSDELLKVATAAEKSGAPVLKVWVGRNINPGDLQQGSFDEEALLGTVESMLADTRNFAFEPEAVTSLRQKFEAATARRDEYLSFALKQQRARLENLLKNPDLRDIEKKQQDLQRYLKKAEAELAAINDPKELARVDAAFKMRVARLKSQNLTIGKLFTEIWKLEEDIREKRMARWEKCSRAIEEFQAQLTIVEQRSLLKTRLLAVLEKTKQRLDQLPPDQQPKPNERTKNPLPTASARQKEGQHTPKIKNGRKKSEQEDKAAAPISEPPRNEVSNEKISDIRRLRNVVETARKTSNKIRVLIPTDHASRYEAGWQGVFRALGFTGDLEFGDYQRLARTSDFVSPVVVPKKMNTHTELWDKSAFSCVMVTEISSTNLLKKMIERS